MIGLWTEQMIEVKEKGIIIGDNYLVDANHVDDGSLFIALREKGLTVLITEEEDTVSIFVYQLPDVAEPIAQLVLGKEEGDTEHEPLLN